MPPTPHGREIHTFSFTYADLTEIERAAFDRGEAVWRATSGNPAYGRWFQKMDFGPSYDERRKAEGW
jgi:hypothetical protein